MSDTLFIRAHKAASLCWKNAVVEHIQIIQARFLTSAFPSNDIKGWATPVPQGSPSYPAASYASKLSSFPELDTHFLILMLILFTETIK